MDEKIVSGLSMVAAFMAAAILIPSNHDSRENATRAEVKTQQASERPNRAPVPPLVPELQRSLAVTADQPDILMLAQGEHQYRFLIADVEQEHVDELRRRLLDRASEIDIGTRARVDAGISKLLPGGSLAYYQLLKESGPEQHPVDAARPLAHEQYPELKDCGRVEHASDLSPGYGRSVTAARNCGKNSAKSASKPAR